MRIIIIEDESPAAEQLSDFIRRYDGSIGIEGVFDSVEESVAWLRKNQAPDLIFMDIHLSDGLSFEIFSHLEVSSPIIFTTAYDQYAIKAFKVNSIDYLLKPIKYEDVCAAIDKLRTLQTDASALRALDIAALRESLLRTQRNYKNRFLIRAGEHIRFKTSEEIAYLYAEGKITFLVDTEGKKYVIDYTLEELENLLDPEKFFRATRKLIIKLGSISRIVTYPNSRVKLFVTPAFNGDIIVSREKTRHFLSWLDR